jgi:hypothetical protein
VSRRLTIGTKELGNIQVLLIYCRGDEWEPEWRALKGHPVANLFSVTTEADLNHALSGWTSPLVKGLGLAPSLALHSLPEKRCALWGTCVFRRPVDCLSTSKKTPWCFEPFGLEGDEAKNLGREVVQLWREGVYMLVVQQETA